MSCRSGFRRRRSADFIGALLIGCGALAANAAELEAEIAVGLLLPEIPHERASLSQGAALGIERANQMPGRKARLVTRGQPGQWGSEGNDGATLALDDGVAGLITPTGGMAAHEILQISGRTQIPVVSLCPDSSITGAAVPWAVQIVPDNRQEASAILAGVEKKAGMPLRWAALVPSERAGREPARDLKAAAKVYGRQLLNLVELSTNPLDATKQLDRILASRPQAVLLWIDSATAGRLARELRQSGFSGWLAGPGPLCSATFLTPAGDAADGFVVPSIPGGGDSDASGGFQKKYRDRFSAAPDRAALMAHDAVLLLVQVARDSGPAPSHRLFPIKKSLQGASGVLRFSANGCRIVPIELLMVKSGEFKPIEP